MSDRARAFSSNIVLIGFMGTGKSVVGKALSRKLNIPYRDSDMEVERIAQMSIREMFERHGEAAFRENETRYLNSLVKSTIGRNPEEPGQPFVLSTGGGTPILDQNRSLINQIGVVICLSTTPEIIHRRVSRHLEQRPLLAAYRSDPLSRIKTLLKERMPIYSSCADFVVETMAFDQPYQVADHIIKLLSRQ